MQDAHDGYLPKPECFRVIQINGLTASLFGTAVALSDREADAVFKANRWLKIFS
jgi:hypothetical protein